MHSFYRNMLLLIIFFFITFADVTKLLSQIVIKKDSTLIQRNPFVYTKSDTVKSYKNKYIPLSVLCFALGNEHFSGDVTNSLNSGLSGQIFEVEYIPSQFNFLNLSFTLFESGDYNYKFTAIEKKKITERYEKIYEGGISTPFSSGGTPINPDEDFKLKSWRTNVNVKFYPIKGSLCPFIGFGLGLFYLATDLKGDSDPGTGFQSYYRIGTDFYPIKRWNSVFFRVEYSSGSVPDWYVRLVPELKIIRGGRFEILRFGIGVDFTKLEM